MSPNGPAPGGTHTDGTGAVNPDGLPAGILPVASGRASWRHVRRLVGEQRRPVLLVLALQMVASAAGLVGPRVLENVINATTAGRGVGHIDEAIAIFAGALVIQTVLTGASRGLGAVLGERVLARLREELVARVLDLPLGVVERAGSGDLLTRASTDVDDLSYTVRAGLPQLLVASITALLAVAALLWTAPILGLALVPSIPLLTAGARLYLKRARSAYQQEMAAYALVNSDIQESVSAGRTIEAFRLGPRRIVQTDGHIKGWIGWERATLALRTRFFGVSEVSYVIPLVLTILLGGLLHMDGRLSLGAVTAAALYAQQLIGPVDTLLAWMDEVQVASASLSRVLGVHEVEPAPTTTEQTVGEDVVAAAVRFAYDHGRDVLRGVDLAPAPGARVAVVGPSGAGKSTLALLLAGVYAPARGRATVGGVDAHLIPPARLRQEIALVTQEHHLFAASIRDNLRLVAPGAGDDELLAALDAVDAGDAVRGLPDGLDTRIGSAGTVLGPGVAQQIAIARLVLADPHTLVLDEATSLLQPGAARHLERSLARLLEGRTVIAISHRLHTANDADVVAVVEDGRITEFGVHHDLLAAAGSYAALWRSWRGES
ncbi:MAG: ABC transporter ATP-binding protein [Acidimicrobiales bacterium]